MKRILIIVLLTMLGFLTSYILISFIQGTWNTDELGVVGRYFIVVIGLAISAFFNVYYRFKP